MSETLITALFIIIVLGGAWWINDTNERQD
jgi:hypothetical protein